MADRDEKGLFKPGCQAGPGRPPAKHEETLTAAFMSICTPEAMVTATKMLFHQVKRGNVRAIHLWLLYGLGRPSYRVEDARLVENQAAFDNLNQGRDIISRVLARVEAREASTEQASGNGDGRHENN